VGASTRRIDCAPMIVIVTATNDLHAIAIQGRVREFGYQDCHIVECDRLAQGDNVFYAIGLDADRDRVKTSEGIDISISQAELIWLRRLRANQVLARPLTQEEGYEIVNNDCRGALSGLLATKFRGKWISHPDATFRASDKIFQLQVAQQCGFRIPKTIIAQSRTEVTNFFERCGRKIIVKTVVGVNEPFLETREISCPTDFSEESYSASPAIYQEYITGSEHLRLLSMKQKSLCGIVRTDTLDWRSNLNVDIGASPVTDDVHSRVRTVIETLGLEMGVVDIKITPNGELVWLEVNPQGQFIFLEPITGIKFIDEFSQYLIQETRGYSEV
jgi:glutathione synthase/RimK-type ligase-like ATP-grasp enzyme